MLTCKIKECGVSTIITDVLTLSFGQTISQTKFQKKIGASGNEITSDIIKVSNGYVLAGTKNSTTTKDYGKIIDSIASEKVKGALEGNRWKR